MTNTAMSRFHCNTLARQNGQLVIVNAEAFTTEQAACDMRHKRIVDQNAICLERRQDYHKALRRAVTDENPEDDRIPRLSLLGCDYDYAVAACSEPLCVACYESGLVEIPNAV